MRPRRFEASPYVPVTVSQSPPLLVFAATSTGMHLGRTMPSKAARTQKCRWRELNPHSLAGTWT